MSGVEWLKKKLAISRIKKMERYLEEVQCATNNTPDIVRQTPALQKKISKLAHYYESGLWLQDYERDEEGMLPQDLKRGVLAQDTLYELLGRFKTFVVKL